MSDVDVAAIRESLAKAARLWEEAYGSFARPPVKLQQEFADADAELIVLLRNNAEALLDALERAQAASEGVDMLIAQAERRGAVKVQERLEQIPDEVYPTAIFGSLSSEDLAKIRSGIEAAGYTMDSLGGHILRFGYQAAGRIAGEVIAEMEDAR